MIHAGGIRSVVLCDFKCFKKQLWYLISTIIFFLCEHHTLCTLFCERHVTLHSPKLSLAQIPTSVLFKLKFWFRGSQTGSQLLTALAPYGIKKTKGECLSHKIKFCLLASLHSEGSFHPEPAQMTEIFLDAGRMTTRWATESKVRLDSYVCLNNSKSVREYSWALQVNQLGC